MEVVEDDVLWDGIDEDALAALDIDAAIAASADATTTQDGMDGSTAAALRAELKAAHAHIEELSRRLQHATICSPPASAKVDQRRRSPASVLQERRPLTASVTANRSPDAVAGSRRLKKAWCAAAHSSGSSSPQPSAHGGRESTRSPRVVAAAATAAASASVASSQTSPQSASPNVRLPRAKMQQLHSEFACSICYELYLEPVTTPCGHNYCRCCLAKSMQRLGRSCPQCRARIPIGTDLQPNTALASGAHSRRTHASSLEISAVRPLNWRCLYLACAVYCSHRSALR
jgi:hypothetical protein